MLDASLRLGLNTAWKACPFHPRKISRALAKQAMLIYAYLLMTSDTMLILCGATMCWISPRLKRHWVLGYGSPRSMLNDATWQAANRFAGMALAALALIAMLGHVSLWPMIETSDLGQTVTAASTLSLPFLVMFLTEKYLARRFRV